MFRPEHPNPAKKHSSFINLNGTWEFEFDNTLVGISKKYYEKAHLSGKIEVPFVPKAGFPALETRILSTPYGTDVI